jgi:hypothetical protein
MGYRSKVILGVKEDLSKNFDGILHKHDFKTDNSSTYLKTILVDDYMVYQFDYIKWYDNDDWCKEIMDWLKKLNKKHNKLDDCWCIGMGEDGELHSEVGDYWEHVDIIRDINLTK